MLLKSRFVEMFGAEKNKVTLKECCEIHARIGWQALTKDEHMKSGDYMLVTGTDFDNNSVNYDSCVYVSKDRYEMDPHIILKNDDILVTKDGTIGKVAIVKGLPKPATLNSGIFVIRPDERFDKDYIANVFKGPIFSQFVDEVKTGATIKHLNQGKLQHFEIPVPSLSKQIQFSKFCNQLDKLKVILNQIDEKIELLKKSRFVEMIGDPVVNPYNWQRLTIKDVCSSIVRGPFGSALKKEFFVADSVDSYKVYEQKNAIQKNAEIGNYYIDKDKYEELKRFECVSGDILMSCSGTVGELYQLPPNCRKGVINQALCKFSLNNRILPTLFLSYMKETIGNISTQGSAIKNVSSVAFIKSIPIIVPPIEVQKRYIAEVQQLDKLKVAIHKELELIG